MRQVLPEKLEAGRVTVGQFASKREWGPYGQFRVQGPCGEQLTIVASGADADDHASQGWEHVSVSTTRRCPNWVEMCFVKDLFWNDDEAVVQFHPPKSDYLNNHPYCLHLWRDRKAPFPMPPAILVGVKDAGILNAESAHELRKQYGW